MADFWREVFSYLGFWPTLGISVAVICTSLLPRMFERIRGSKKSVEADAPLNLRTISSTEEAAEGLEARRKLLRDSRRMLKQYRKASRIPPRARPQPLRVEEPSLQKFGSELRELRRSRRLTQYQLAMAVGVSATYISEVELGKRRPSFDVLRDVISLLELESEELARLVLVMKEDRS